MNYKTPLVVKNHRYGSIKYERIAEWPSKCDTCLYRRISGVLNCDFFKYDRPNQYWFDLDQETDQTVTSVYMYVVFKALPSDVSAYVVRCQYYKLDKSQYYNYLRSARWKAKRTYMLRQADYQCQRCGSANNLEVHHISYEHAGEEPLDDLIVLCKDCHREIHRNDFDRRLDDNA